MGTPAEENTTSQSFNTDSAIAASPTAPVSSGAGAPVANADAGASPAQGAPAPAADPEHENPGKHVLHAIMGALGGTEETELSRDPQTGKLIVTATKSGPGQQWKRIIAGALTGAAAGASVKPGPGRLSRAAGAGFGAGQKFADQREQGKLDQANEDFDYQQKAMVRKAQVAHLNQEVASSAWALTRQKAEFAIQNTAMTTSFHNLVGSDPENQDFGVYKSFPEFLEKHGNNGAEIGRMNANQELRAMPEFDSEGKVAGIHVWRVSPGWNDRKSTQPIQIDFGPKINAEGKADHDIQTIPAGSMTNGEIVTAQQAGSKKWLDYIDKTQVTPKEKFQQEEEGKRNAATNATHVQVARIKEEGENARADKKAKGDVSPVYAFDPTSNKTILTTKAQAAERNLTGIRPVKETDIKADQHDIRVLNDVSLKANNVRNAAKAMDDRSWGQAAMVARYLADNPNTTTNKLINSSVMKHLNPAAKTYVITVLNLRESSMGLQKVLTGSARQNETQLQALLNTLPGVEPDSATAEQKLTNFTQNITMLRQGVPELPGMSTVELNPETHVFSKAAWLKANPNGDINAAVAAAQKQNYQITD